MLRNLGFLMSVKYEKIEREARRLQFEIWSQRAVLFEMGEPPLIQQFDPAVAARVCGLEYEYREHISAAGNATGLEAAGQLDRGRGIISISTRFNFEVQRFTGAHEIGHFVLHDWVGERTIHRDRPVANGVNFQRPVPEQEADYFAACFLAPRKLVEREFVARFGRVPLTLTEDLAFHLQGDTAHLLMTAPTGSLDFAIALASAYSIDGRHFKSLARHFGLSTSAMAIRLRELGLVQA
jgi:Zn-dependent peptidase ImmA (M78 family)